MPTRRPKIPEQDLTTSYHFILLACLLLAIAPPAFADQLDDLARDFRAWRRLNQPLSNDDIPRIDRPAEWTPDWSPATIAQRRQKLVEFEQRWRKINAAGWPAGRQVDYRLIGSAIARARWELEVTRGWRRNPNFYIHQTLGAIFDRLLQPPPFDVGRRAINSTCARFTTSSGRTATYRLRCNVGSISA